MDRVTHLKHIVDELTDCADIELVSMIMTDQDAAEKECLRTGMYADEWIDGPDGRQPIVYPENAAPELDQARDHLHQAIALMESLYE